MRRKATACLGLSFYRRENPCPAQESIEKKVEACLELGLQTVKADLGLGFLLM